MKTPASHDDVARDATRLEQAAIILVVAVIGTLLSHYASNTRLYLETRSVIEFRSAYDDAVTIARETFARGPEALARDTVPETSLDWTLLFNQRIATTIGPPVRFVVGAEPEEGQIGVVASGSASEGLTLSLRRARYYELEATTTTVTATGERQAPTR